MALSASEQESWTLVYDDSTETLTTSDLRAALERGNDDVKIDTLRRVIISTLNGQPHPTLLMPIIQFVLPSKNKAIKKLLHFYWEICPKHDENGKLKQEMILVCNAIRNDLQHPNEYIRGATLRFLQKIREADLLEPLIPTVRLNLEHRHSYVRKNAVLAILNISSAFESLIPDAAELIQTFLIAESDPTCRRNAFIALLTFSPQLAHQHFLQIYDSIASADELMQLAVLEMVRRSNDAGEGATGGAGAGPKGKYLRIVFELLNVPALSVRYEAAVTLTGMSGNPAAVKAAASTFIDLILKGGSEDSNNVKLIVLDRLDALRRKHDHVLDDLVMDILRVLSSPDMEVRRKVLALALEMVGGGNVDDVVSFLKKELTKTRDGDFEKNPEYRQLLIQSIHTCAIRFSEVASSVVHVLMEFLGDLGPSATAPVLPADGGPPPPSSAVEVIAFVREVVEKFPNLRSGIVEKLLSTMQEIRSGKVFRGALWIVGEYGETVEDIKEAFTAIRRVIGDIPILDSEQRLLEDSTAGTGEDGAAQSGAANGDSSVPITKTKVLADGTYATETVYSQQAQLDAVKSANKPPLRSLILGGDYFTGAVLASTLTKLVLRFRDLAKDSKKFNEIRAEAMLIMTSIIRVGQSQFSATPIDEDSVERITVCLHSLASTASPLESTVKTVFLSDTQAAYTKMVKFQERKAAEQRAKDEKAVAVQPDDLVGFRLLGKKNAGAGIEWDKETGSGGNKGLAAGAPGTEGEAQKDDFASKLSRVVQLTGFSDPVYAEAYVNVHQFDILLDVLIVNQTSETLQNLSVEFATLGDLKLVERPTQHTLGPHSFQSIKATIKVSSTETGVIFGNIFYDGPATADSYCVVLNDIHIDILDYINPAYCNEGQFRSMWTEFEWENKVNVNTTISNLRTYLDHIMASTNMSCLTPEAALQGDCGFLSANMYARSLFGEDALANLSIEKLEDGTLQGHVRIRSKQQGIALSLGDKITLAQKAVTAAA